MRSSWILLAGLFAACRGSTDPETPPIGSPQAGAVVQIAPPAEVTLAIGQSLRLTDPDLQVFFEAVPEDSRCPMNVVCMWIGDARVAFQASGEVERRFSLHFPTEQIGSGSIQLGVYQIQITALTPTPVAEQTTPAAEYRVTLKVRRL